MLSLFGNGFSRTCAGVSRREFLRVGSLALGGLSLPQLLAAQANAGTKRVLKDKSVVLLFLVGGPPQVETFDPKPDAPDNTRSCTGHLATKTPGVRFGGTFPRLATMTDRFSIVRSFGSGDSGHNHIPVLTGNNTLRAPMGALAARALGSMNTRTGVPNNNVIVPESIEPKLKLGNPTGPFTIETVKRQFLPATGLGSGYDAFMPLGGDSLLTNLQLQIPRERFDDRQALLRQIDALKRNFDETSAVESLDSFQQQAHDVLLSRAVEAFDIGLEDPRTVAKYDTSHFFRMEDYHKGGKYYRGLVNQSRSTNLLGKQMLMARRLCEAGAGFVTVVDTGWDFHGDGNNPPTPIGMNFMGPQLDHAIAAFLDDLHERGLSDKILLLVTGEMGRGSRKGSNGGTGHHGDLTPLLVAGGGLKMGQIIGTTDPSGSKPTSTPYRPEHLLTTVLHTYFDLAELRIDSGAVPGAVGNLALNGEPIKELF